MVVGLWMIYQIEAYWESLLTYQQCLPLLPPVRVGVGWDGAGGVGRGPPTPFPPSSTWATCNRQNTLEPVYAAPPASDHAFLLHSAEVSLNGMPRDAWSLAMQPQHNSQQGLTGWQTGAVGPQKSASPLGIRCLHPHDSDALPPPAPLHTHTHCLERQQLKPESSG